MEAAMQARANDVEQTGRSVVSIAEAPDRVVDISASMKDKLLHNAAEGAASGKRDWSSALDLVSEAFEAIRMADERAAASQEHLAELVQRHADQVKVLESRLAAFEKRADVAENRAKVAEGWLLKFHDKIVDEFQRSFVPRSVER